MAMEDMVVSDSPPETFFLKIKAGPDQSSYACAEECVEVVARQPRA